MTADSAPANDANASGALQILVPVQPSKTTDSYARTLPTLAPVHVKSLTLAGMGNAMPTRVLGPAAGDNRIKMIATEQAKNTQRCNALVVGAGLGGMAAAIGIRKAGHNMIVLERMPELREVRTSSCILQRVQKLTLRVSDWCWDTGAAKLVQNPQEVGHFGSCPTGRAAS